jgi:hypothetical protein
MKLSSLRKARQEEIINFIDKEFSVEREKLLGTFVLNYGCSRRYVLEIVDALVAVGKFKINEVEGKKFYLIKDAESADEAFTQAGI